jgi:hypothetical protein
LVSLNEYTIFDPQDLRRFAQRVPGLRRISIAKGMLVAFLAGVLLPAMASAGAPPNFPNAVGNDRYVVHYPDSVSHELAQQSLAAFNPIPDMVTAMGFRRTIPDDHASINAFSPFTVDQHDRSGDPRYDIYIDPSIQNAAGYSGLYWIAVLPDFATNFHTLTHEYFHTVQQATDGGSSYGSWMGESLANWVPGHLRPHGNEGLENVSDHPSRGLFHDCNSAGDCFTGDEYISRAGWESLGEYLTVRFGERFIVDLYERARALSPPPYDAPRDVSQVGRQALTQELEARGATIPEVFAAYARASAFPTYGYIAPPDGIFGDRTSWGTNQNVDALRHDANPKRFGPEEYFVPPYGLRLLPITAIAGDRVDLAIESDPALVSSLQTYGRAAGIAEIPGGSGAARSFTVPPGADRVVRLVLANPTDSAFTALVSGEARDETGPALANLRLPRKVDAGERPRIRFSLSEAGEVEIELRRCRRGGTNAGCRGGSSKLGEVDGAAEAGGDALRLSSRLGKRLRPGHHEVVASATDAAGNDSDEVTRGFEVVK